MDYLKANGKVAADILNQVNSRLCSDCMMELGRDYSVEPWCTRCGIEEEWGDAEGIEVQSKGH